MSDKLWNGILDGCMSQIPTYDSSSSTTAMNKGESKEKAAKIVSQKQKDKFSINGPTGAD